eukprot:scaffold1085_cov407-Prasinococcus_capsulatus_cf.AAC.45
MQRSIVFTTSRLPIPHRLHRGRHRPAYHGSKSNSRVAMNVVALPPITRTLERRTWASIAVCCKPGRQGNENITRISNLCTNSLWPPPPPTFTRTPRQSPA